MKKIWILGASGYLGRNLLRGLSHSYKVVAVSRKIFEIAGKPPENWLSIGEWRKALEKDSHNSLCVINCVAITSHLLCEQDPKLANNVNCLFALEAAKYCQSLGVKFVQIGTDGLFFDSAHKNAQYWTKSNTVNVLNEYARSKRLAEMQLETLNWGTALRLSFVGPSLGSQKGLIHFLASQSSKNQIMGYDDNLFSPLHTSQLSHFIESEVETLQSKFNLLQLASYPALSKYEFLKQIAEKAGLTTQVLPQNRASTLSAVATPLDQSLQSDRFFSTEDVLTLSSESLREEISALSSGDLIF